MSALYEYDPCEKTHLLLFIKNLCDFESSSYKNILKNRKFLTILIIFNKTLLLTF